MGVKLGLWHKGKNMLVVWEWSAEGYVCLFLKGGGSILLLEGSQEMPAYTDKEVMRVKTLDVK
jgi:hypothetical protein